MLYVLTLKQNILIPQSSLKNDFSVNFTVCSQFLKCFLTQIYAILCIENLINNKNSIYGTLRVSISNSVHKKRNELQIQ